jgi:hypothetical protein
MNMHQKRWRPAAGGTAKRGAECSRDGEHLQDSAAALVINDLAWRAPAQPRPDPALIRETAADLLSAGMPICALRSRRTELYPGQSLLDGEWPEEHASDRDVVEEVTKVLFDQFGTANLGVRRGVGGLIVLRIAAARLSQFSNWLEMMDHELPSTWLHTDLNGDACHLFRAPKWGAAGFSLFAGAEVVASSGVHPVPPSVGKSGEACVWEVRPRDCSLADLPAWLKLRRDAGADDILVDQVHSLARSILKVVQPIIRSAAATEKLIGLSEAPAKLEALGLTYPSWRDDVSELLEDADDGDAEETRREAFALALRNHRHVYRNGADLRRPQLTPITLGREEDLPPRDWLIPGVLLRGRTCVDAGMGGGAKSTQAVREACTLALGRPLLGPSMRPAHRVPVLIVPGEDTADDWRAMVFALLRQYGIDPKELDGWLYILEPGRWDLADSDGHPKRDQVDEFIAYVRKHDIGAVFFDPFASFAAFAEVDSGKMDRVIKGAFNRLAQEADCAVKLVHHLRKVGDRDPTIDDVRGSVALVNAARLVRIITPMSAAEAGAHGVDPDEANLIRKVTVVKSNFGPARGTTWFKVGFVTMANGDDVAVAEPYQLPDPYEEVPGGRIRACQERIHARRANGEGYRYSERAKDADAWVGIAVADVLGYDLLKLPDLQRTRFLIEQWIDPGVGYLKRVDLYLPGGKKTAPFIEVDRWVEV